MNNNDGPKVARIKAKYHSCNFCQAGVLDGNTLKYPYSEVFLLSGNALSTSICDECAKKIVSKLSNPTVSK